LPKEAVQAFTRQGSFKNLTSGEILLHQGEQGDAFYLLVRGSVDVSIDGRSVKEITEGGFFGEIALLTNAPRNATIKAKENSIVLKISRGDFWHTILGNLNLGVCIETIAEHRLIEDNRL
jgi:cAMP-dependent protein kinase regulator